MKHGRISRSWRKVEAEDRSRRDVSIYLRKSTNCSVARPILIGVAIILGVGAVIGASFLVVHVDIGWDDRMDQEGERDASSTERTPATDDEGLCNPHPSAPIPRTGAPDNLPGDWGRLELDFWDNRTLEEQWPELTAGYSIAFVSGDRFIVYKGFQFNASQGAQAFFSGQAGDTSGAHWDPGLGEASIAWFESPTEFQMVIQEGQVVLHLEEMSTHDEEQRTGESSEGPFPTVLYAVSQWLEPFQNPGC